MLGTKINFTIVAAAVECCVSGNELTKECRTDEEQQEKVQGHQKHKQAIRKASKTFRVSLDGKNKTTLN